MRGKRASGCSKKSTARRHADRATVRGGNQYHTIMGTKNGLTRKEFEEIIYTAIPYCGFPVAATAKRGILEGFDAMDGGS